MRNHPKQPGPIFINPIRSVSVILIVFLYESIFHLYDFICNSNFISIPAKKEPGSSSSSGGGVNGGGSAEGGAGAITPQMLMSPFGHMFPGGENGFMPFMYPTAMPPFYPGLGLPFMQPGFFPPGELTVPSSRRAVVDQSVPAQ